MGTGDQVEYEVKVMFVREDGVDLECGVEKIEIGLREDWAIFIHTIS